MKLNQVLAVERNIKNTAPKRVTDAHRKCAKGTLFMGFVKDYSAAREGGLAHPTKRTKVQFTVAEAFATLREEYARLFDVTQTKDAANCEARADVVVDGVTIITQAPATFLLWAEKKLQDVRKFINEVPTLDGAYDWRLDTNDGLFKADGGRTESTKKVQKPIVMYDATPEHPAQCQLVSEDVVVGHWKTVLHSGAIPATTKAGYLKRVDTLYEAVVKARETANQIDATSQYSGEAIFKYIFGE